MRSLEVNIPNKELPIFLYLFKDNINLIDASKLRLPEDIYDFSYYSMFDGCKKLKNIGDISSWDVSNVMGITCMFLYCENLNSVGDIDKWGQKLPEKLHKMNAFYKSPLSASWYK